MLLKNHIINDVYDDNRYVSFALTIVYNLSQLDFWTGLSRLRPIDVRVSPGDFGKLQSLLSTNGIAFTVQHSDLQEYVNLIIILHENINQTLVNSLHGLLNCEIGGLDCRVITTEYKIRINCIYMLHLFCNALVYVIYSDVSGKCFHTIVLQYY